MPSLVSLLGTPSLPLFYVPFLVAFASFALHNDVCLFRCSCSLGLRSPFFFFAFFLSPFIFDVAIGERGIVHGSCSSSVWRFCSFFFVFSWFFLPSPSPGSSYLRRSSGLCCGFQIFIELVFSINQHILVFGVCSTILALPVSAWTVVRSESQCETCVPFHFQLSSWFHLLAYNGPSLIC